MKVSSRFVNGNLCFKDFIVVRESPRFYGVYELSVPDFIPMGGLITSGETLDKAAAKAKLLQIGYDVCRNNNYSDDLFNY